MMAYDEGLKGITYMRDGSRQGVLERVEPKKEEKKEEPVMKLQKRPTVMVGATYETETPFGHSFITINSDKDGNPFEVFINSGKSGSDVMAMSEALGRIISMVLRMQSPIAHRERVRQIVSQLTGIGGARTVGFGMNKVRSMPDALAKVLAEHFSFKVNGRVVDAKTPSAATGQADSPNGNGATNGNGHGVAQNTAHQPVQADTEPQTMVLQQLTLPQEESRQLFDICPDCGGASLAREEGCKKCYACGYAEC